MDMVLDLQKNKRYNVPREEEIKLLEESYFNILNKKKILYKYVFMYNNKKFKFQLLSTYYEYLIICKDLITDVTTCNIFFHKKIFSEMLKKPFYYPYILYIYEDNSSYQHKTDVEKTNKKTFNCENICDFHFIKTSILDIEQIIEKGKKKEKKYFNNQNNKIHTENIMYSIPEINTELEKYNLNFKHKKSIIGYVELYLLFHMGRFFDSRVERLVIHKLFQNKKLGNIIMHISIFLLKYLYISNRCDLTVENEYAIKLYKKLGFQRVDTDVYRLYLHSNYNYLKEIEGTYEMESENIHTFMNNTFACILQKEKNHQNEKDKKEERNCAGYSSCSGSK